MEAEQVTLPADVNQVMEAKRLAEVCLKALKEDKYVKLTHRGIARDVYPFTIKEGRLYCWCSLHPDREVEGMWISNIFSADVSKNEIGYNFGYPSDFSPEY